METLGDLVARDRLAADVVLSSDEIPTREYDYRRFCTTVWKTGNFLRHLGVCEGTTVAVADRPAPEPVFAFLGATLLGATVRFDPPTDPDCRVVVAPTGEVGDFDLPPGGKRVGYGDRPTDPTAQHFETEMWSENPTFPDTDVVDGDDPALVAGDATYPHRALLAAAARVAVRAPLRHSGTVVAGLLAPLSAGATIRLTGPDSPAGDVRQTQSDEPTGAESPGDVDELRSSDGRTWSGDIAVVADDSAPEPRTIRAGEVLD